jgi:3-hydroxymyristoyl/3-hydroxydecanoyl-(acyl carrier protein) dehydratase
MRLRTILTFPAEHPAFAGHFPGTPILPAVVLLDEVLWALEKAGATPVVSSSVASAKLLDPVRPGETLVLTCEGEAGAVRFSLTREGAAVASGLLRQSVSRAS